MKIISGIYKGRNLTGFTMPGTRPTQDRVKESIFSMIQEKVPNSVVLDLFAGSGNLGIEALSNGSQYVHFVDHSYQAYQAIQKNLENLNISNAKVYKMDYRKALEQFVKQQIQFDLIFLDPPYKDQILNSILIKLQKFHLLSENALIVCEYENNQFFEEYPHLKLIKQKTYGSKNVKIYQMEDK